MTDQTTLQQHRTQPQRPVDVSRFEGYVEERRRHTQLTVGRALEKARVRIGFTVQAAAFALHMSERDLGHFEAGLRTPSAAQLEDMAELYGTKIGAFGARSHEARIPPHIDFESETLWIGWTPISIAADAGGNTHIIRSLADAIRLMRGLTKQQPVYMRQHETPLIGSLLDLTDDDLPAAVMHHFGLTYSETKALLDQMRGWS